MERWRANINFLNMRSGDIVEIDPDEWTRWINAGYLSPLDPPAHDPDGLVYVGGGWFELPDGSRHQGREAAVQALRQSNMVAYADAAIVSKDTIRQESLDEAPPMPVRALAESATIPTVRRAPTDAFETERDGGQERNPSAPRPPQATHIPEPPPPPGEEPE